MKCSEDVALLKRFVERDRSYDFLVGLNIEFDAVRVQILGKEDAPSLNETIAFICAEEGKRWVMLETLAINWSTLVTKNRKNHSLERQMHEERKSLDGSKLKNKDSLWCNYCKKLRHTIDKCWKLQLKPQTISKRTSRQKWTSKGTGVGMHCRCIPNWGKEFPRITTTVAFNMEEMTKLKNLLGSLEKQTRTGTCTLALLGISSSSHTLNALDISSPSIWIIDSRATNHMTYYSETFLLYPLLE